MISQSVTCQIQKIWDRPCKSAVKSFDAWNFLWENVAWSMLKPISGQRVATGFIPLQPLHVLRSQSHVKKSSGFHMYRDWHKAIHWFQGPCTWARTWEVFPFDSRHSSCREKQNQAEKVRNCWFVHEKSAGCSLLSYAALCSYGAALIWSFSCFSNVDVPLKVPKFWPKPRDIWVLLRSACRGRRTLSR